MSSPEGDEPKEADVVAFREDYESVIAGLNRFADSDWNVLKEVLRRHCRTPVSDYDLDAATADLEDAFPTVLTTRGRAFVMLMLLGGHFGDESVEELAAAGDSELLTLADGADSQLEMLRRMFGRRLRHLLDLPTRSERDWVRIHFEDYEVVGGNSSPIGTLVTRIRIELRNGEMLDFQGPPRSLINLVSVCLSHIEEWDEDVVGSDVFLDETGRIGSRLDALRARIEAATES